MAEEFEGPEAGGVSRRDMLRRSAVVGGALVWAVPAVQSISSSAWAQTVPSPETPGPCVNFYVVKIDVPGGECEDNPGSGGFECVSTAGALAGGCQFVLGFSGDETGFTVVLEGASQQITARSKCGNPATPESAGCDPAEVMDDQPNGDILVFSQCPSGPQGQDQEISHVEIRFCHP